MFIVTIITDLSSLPTALKFQPLIVWLNYALLAQYTDVIGLNENCFFPIILKRKMKRSPKRCK